MEELYKYINKIKQLDNKSMEISRNIWDSIAIPLGSLGKIQDIVVKLCGIYGTYRPDEFKKAVVVMCADNGIVDEGVTQSPKSVTGIVAENMTTDKATISIMSNFFGGDVFVVDVGMESEHKSNNNIINKKISNGTKNFIKEPAMSKKDCENAILTGVNMVEDLKAKGYNLIATGEMGIGNTTTSSALACVLLNKSAEEVTGRGAGISDEALNKKISVIKQGIRLHNVENDDVIGHLNSVGGFDIAAMVGVFIGGAVFKIPILIDGFISGIAALIAIKLCPDVKNFMFATHVSSEPAGKMIIEALNLPHIIEAGMRLGEGSGAVLAYPIFEVGLKIYKEMASFEDAKIHKYVRLN